MVWQRIKHLKLLSTWISKVHSGQDGQQKSLWSCSCLYYFYLNIPLPSEFPLSSHRHRWGSFKTAAMALLLKSPGKQWSCHWVLLWEFCGASSLRIGPMPEAGAFLVKKELLRAISPAESDDAVENHFCFMKAWEWARLPLSPLHCCSNVCPIPG